MSSAKTFLVLKLCLILTHPKYWKVNSQDVLPASMSQFAASLQGIKATPAPKEQPQPVISVEALLKALDPEMSNSSPKSKGWSSLLPNPFTKIKRRCRKFRPFPRPVRRRPNFVRKVWSLLLPKRKLPPFCVDDILQALSQGGQGGSSKSESRALDNINININNVPQTINQIRDNEPTSTTTTTTKAPKIWWEEPYSDSNKLDSPSQTESSSSEKPKTKLRTINLLIKSMEALKQKEESQISPKPPGLRGSSFSSSYETVPNPKPDANKSIEDLATKILNLREKLKGKGNEKLIFQLREKLKIKELQQRAKQEIQVQKQFATRHSSKPNDSLGIRILCRLAEILKDYFPFGSLWEGVTCI